LRVVGTKTVAATTIVQSAMDLGYARVEACVECGACQLSCPTGALVVDSGVGCAAAMIRAALRGRKEASCGAVECA
jgi:ferredoxin